MSTPRMRPDPDVLQTSRRAYSSGCRKGYRSRHRAWLDLPKDATLVHYAKRIKAERDHVLEEIMPSMQRTLFGTAATSLKEYVPLHGVARVMS